MTSFHHEDSVERVVQSDATDEQKLAELTRRSFLIRTGGLAAAAGLSGGLAQTALAAA
jgi:hypothetical protein